MIKSPKLLGPISNTVKALLCSLFFLFFFFFAHNSITKLYIPKNVFSNTKFCLLPLFFNERVSLGTFGEKQIKFKDVRFLR